MHFQCHFNFQCHHKKVGHEPGATYSPGHWSRIAHNRTRMRYIFEDCLFWESGVNNKNLRNITGRKDPISNRVAGIKNWEVSLINHRGWRQDFFSGGWGEARLGKLNFFSISEGDEI